MSDTIAHELARAVLRAYFDGAAFRRVPARCIRAVEQVLARTNGNAQPHINEDGTKGP